MEFFHFYFPAIYITVLVAKNSDPTSLIIRLKVQISGPLLLHVPDSANQSEHHFRCPTIFWSFCTFGFPAQNPCRTSLADIFKGTQNKSGGLSRDVVELSQEKHSSLYLHSIELIHIFFSCCNFVTLKVFFDQLT